MPLIVMTVKVWGQIYILVKKFRVVRLDCLEFSPGAVGNISHLCPLVVRGPYWRPTRTPVGF